MFVVTVLSVVESFAAEMFIAACTCYILVSAILHAVFNAREDCGPVLRGFTLLFTLSLF